MTSLKDPLGIFNTVILANTVKKVKRGMPDLGIPLFVSSQQSTVPYFPSCVPSWMVMQAAMRRAYT